jgi:hypothetical protein
MAVALAANAHADLHPRSPINSVFVEELEPPPSSALERISDGRTRESQRVALASR